MGINTILNNGIAQILNDGGITTTVKLISFAFSGADYDDVTIQTATGSNIVSGLYFPVRGKQGSNEAMLLEQGKLLTQDKVLYTGSVNTSGNILIELGSNLFYNIISDGVTSWDVNGSTIYNKFYIRRTLNGSLF